MIDPVNAMEMLTSDTTVETAKNKAVNVIVKVQNGTESGRTALWVVFILMLISSAGFSLMAWKVPLSKRLFHTVTTLITITAAISYYAMASGHGIGQNLVSSHVTEYLGDIPIERVDTYRPVYWARYVDWAITTPLLLTDLGLLAGMAGGHLFMAIVADVIMVLTGLFAAFPNNENQKWGWYAIACIAFLVIIWHLAINGRRVVASQSNKVKNLYGSLAGFTIIIWTAYPIIWGLSEGSRIMNVDAEIIAYAVLDLLAKPVFGFWLLFAHQAISETKVEVNGFWAHGLGGEGAVRLEDDDGA